MLDSTQSGAQKVEDENKTRLKSQMWVRVESADTFTTNPQPAHLPFAPHLGFPLSLCLRNEKEKIIVKVVASCRSSSINSGCDTINYH